MAMLQIVLNPDKPNVEWPKGVPADLQEWIERCWERDPKKRVTMGDVVHKLQKMVCSLLSPKNTA